MVCGNLKGCGPIQYPAIPPDPYWLQSFDLLLLALPVILLIALVVLAVRQNVRHRWRWVLVIAALAICDVSGLRYEVHRGVEKAVKAMMPCPAAGCRGALRELD